jgi:hypothetical protein
MATHHVAALGLAASLGLAFSLACQLQDDEDLDPADAALLTAIAAAEQTGTPDPLTDYAFLTPVAEAQAAGISPYWMGEAFPAETLTFEIRAKAEWFETDAEPHLNLNYGADTQEGAIPFDLQSLSEDGAASKLEDARRVATLLQLPTAQTTERPVVVGPWYGILLVLPGPTEPANELWLFVEVGDGVVVLAEAISVSTGVPGTDANPLLNEDLLISTVAEHLRPYPE